MNALIMILIAIFVIGLYVTIDFMLGRKQHLKSMYSQKYPVRESNLKIIAHGNELFKELFSDLKNARHNIHIIFYICKNDGFSQEFLSILKEKAQEGIEVRLLLDWVGSIKFKRKTIKELKSFGVQFAFCHKPKLPFFFYSTQVRNHRKITVIDGEIGYMGGYNVGKEYIDLDPKLSPWRDYHLKMTGEGVSDLQMQFLRDWRESYKTNLSQNQIYFPKLEKGSSKHQLFSSEGFLLEETFSDLIKNAKSSITIGSPYFIPSKKVLQYLLEALQRGVNLTVLVPYQSDHILVKEASFCYFRKLIKKGAHVYQYSNGFYHAKVLIIDDFCDLGTANFDKRSFFLNHEINCFIYDTRVVQEVKNIIQEDLMQSQKMRLEDINSPNLFRSFKEKVAGSISFFL
ncbi:cardiolipin synthase [Bacillus dakarensis]|uniref:cardiolipin synthase n=1 Tax=Robertmurraya dakarensis TaxID=1926278 RepID=UPI000981D7FA|nr:cardiolipin synthase [Bacillus dakarensis]